jgi:hypothetical protein
MAKDFPATGNNGGITDGGLQGNKEANSLVNNGTPFYINVQNPFKTAVYGDVSTHQWTTIAETQARLGCYACTAYLRKRRLISDMFEIFVFFRVFRKEGHRFSVTGKVPRTSPATRQERVFDNQGMPRVQPKSTANCPQYAHPEAAGGDGE